MLQTIESDYNKVKQRCTNMLAMWLQKDVNATWKKLLEVIDSPAVLDTISAKSDHNAGKHVLSCHHINDPAISGPGGPFMFDIIGPARPLMYPDEIFRDSPLAM